VVADPGQWLTVQGTTVVENDSTVGQGGVAVFGVCTENTASGPGSRTIRRQFEVTVPFEGLFPVSVSAAFQAADSGALLVGPCAMDVTDMLSFTVNASVGYITVSHPD
jgi:hypothetical protein